MFTTDKQLYKPGSLLELAKKKLAEKEAHNQRASSLMTNPYTKVGVPYNELRQEPTPPEPTTLQNVGQVVKEHGVAGTVAEGARVVGGAVGNILGKIAGGAIGAIVGGIGGPETQEVLKASSANSTPAIIKQKDPAVTRVQEAIKQSKDLYKKGGIAGRNLGSGFLSYLPQAIQNTIDIGKMSVTDEGRNQFVDYTAQVLAGRDPENIGNPELAKNLLLAGNDTGDLNNINKDVVRKAWFAALLPIFQDIWITSTLGTSALQGFYKNNYKPTQSIKLDLTKGNAEFIAKDQVVRNEIFTPKKGMSGTLEITKAEPTIARKITSPISEWNKPLVRFQYTPAEQVRLGASGQPINPTQTAAVGGALEAPKLQLPKGTGKASAVPVQDSRAAFQMIDPKATKIAQGLKTKLEKAIAEKQALIAKGASPTVIQQVKDLQAIISKIDSKLQTTQQKSIIATGPITQTPSIQPIVSQEPIKTPIQEVKPSTPTVTPVKAPKAVTSKIAKTPQGVIVKETTLYHGSDAGKLKIDKNGNINLSPSKDQITQFGSPLEFDTTGMKVMNFPSKEELFKAVENKGYYSRKGIDILISGNHAIAINPIKFATKVGRPVRDIRKMTVGGEMTKIKEAEPKKPIGRQKQEGTVTVEQAYKSAREVKNIKAKSYRDYLEEDKKRHLERKPIETPEQIHERLQKEKEAVALERARYESFEEPIKGKDLTKRVFEQQLQKWKKEGKDNDFFMKKYQEEFDNGNDLKADALFDFMNNQPGFIGTNHLFDMLTLKPIETALNKGIETGLKFIYKTIGGPQMLESLQTLLKKSKFINKIGRGFIYQYDQPQWYKDLTEATERSIIKSENVAEEMFKYLGKGLDNNEKIELQQAIINGGYSPIAKIEERATVARSVLDDWGEQYYRSGAMSRETFEKNKGAYLLRAYYNYELKDPITTFFKKTGGYKAGLERSKKRGIERTVTISQADKLIQEGWEDRGIIKSRPGYQRIWRDFTKEERIAMDEILDAPEYLVAKTIKQVGYDVAILNKFLETANHPDVVKNVPFKDFVKIPDEKNYGVLRGKYVAPWLANDVKGIMEARSTGENLADKILVEWKRFKVIDNPATQFRNIIWNIINSDIAGLSPLRFDISIPNLFDLFKRGVWYKRARNSNTFGTSSWSGAELAQSLEKNYSIKLKNKEGNFELTKTEKLKEVISNIFDIGKIGYQGFQKIATDIYQGAEEWNKLNLFRYAVEDLKMTDEAAAQFAKKWGLDYGAVTPAMARWSRKWYGMPFLRFQVKVTPLLAESVFTRMATIAKIILTLYYLERKATKLLGMTPEQMKKVKQTLFPSWMQKGVYIPYPERDKYGQLQFLDLTYILPLVDNLHSFNPLDYMLQNPLYRVPSEIAFNKSLFTQDEIIDKTVNPEISKQLKAYIKYGYQQIVPTIVPGGFSFEKVKNSILDNNDISLKEQGVQIQTLSTTFTDVIFGLKLRTFDITVQEKARISELKKENAAFLAEIRSVSMGWGDYKRFTEKEKRKRIKELINHVQDNYKKAAEIQGIDTIGIE